MTAADTPEWAAIADSAARFVATAQALTDDDVYEASALPGWTRAHVLTHIAQGADSRTGCCGQPRPAASASNTLPNKPVPTPSTPVPADRQGLSAPTWIVLSSNA